MMSIESSMSPSKAKYILAREKVKEEEATRRAEAQAKLFQDQAAAIEANFEEARSQTTATRVREIAVENERRRFRVERDRALLEREKTAHAAAKEAARLLAVSHRPRPNILLILWGKSDE
jgi:multidrug efflux pump subunit AcrA (membrane-fusion protein)